VTMTMSKRTIGIIGAAVGVLLIIVLYGLIIRGILQERDQQAALEDQIAPLEAGLGGQQGEGSLLGARQSELATLQAKLVAAQFAFPSEIDSTEVLAHIVTTAAVHRVNLREVQSRTPSTSTVGAGTYRVFSYDVEVEGDLDAVSGFLADLEAGPIETLVLNHIHLDAQPTPTVFPTLPPPLPTLTLPPTPTPTEDPPVYRTSLLVEVYVRLAEPGATPLPPVGTSISPEERTRQLQELLVQAREEEDWERAISLLLVLRQMRPSEPTFERLLVDAYVRDGQRRLAAGQFDQAAADFQAALALQPNNNEAIGGMSVLQALTPTSTPLPTSTPTETPTPTPTITPTLTPTPLPYYVLHLSFGPNERYPSLGCDWFGFAGRITDPGGYGVAGVTVRVWAPGWPGLQQTTGVSGEWEQFLDSRPRHETWLVQLYEQGIAVSEVITVESRASCDSMLIEMDWRRGY
jgi:tetratricopeptide (TPR) repeat protein